MDDDDAQTVCAGYYNTPNGFEYHIILVIGTAERWRRGVVINTVWEM